LIRRGLTALKRAADLEQPAPDVEDAW